MTTPRYRRPCKHIGCSEPARAARGLCWVHYCQLLRLADTLTTAPPPSPDPQIDAWVREHCPDTWAWLHTPEGAA